MKSFRLKFFDPLLPYLESYFIIPLLLDSVVSLLPSPYYLESYFIIPLLNSRFASRLRTGEYGYKEVPQQDEYGYKQVRRNIQRL